MKAFLVGLFLLIGGIAFGQSPSLEYKLFPLDSLVGAGAAFCFCANVVPAMRVRHRARILMVVMMVLIDDRTEM